MAKTLTKRGTGDLAKKVAGVTGEARKRGCSVTETVAELAEVLRRKPRMVWTLDRIGRLASDSLVRRLNGGEVSINDALAEISGKLRKPSERAAMDAAVEDYVKEKAAEVGQKDAARSSLALSTAAAREALFLEQFKGVAEKLLGGRIVPSGYATKESARSPDRILNLMVSDTHFHSLLEAEEVGHRYGPEEEARRLAAVALQTVDYKTRHRDKTTLFLHLAGDIIQGQLHDPRDGAPLAAQACAAIHLLTQMIGYFSRHFPRVVVRCTPGNHGRNTARHRERAINQKWDSIEQIVYYGVKTAVAGLRNVGFEIGTKPYYTFEAFGERGFVTHGDTVFKPGYPGKSVDVAGIRQQVNEINAAFAGEGERYSLVAVGHVHIGSLVNLPEGGVFISNGCLVPPDSYATGIGIHSTACGQYLWESVEGHVVGDSRFLNVGFETDEDASLDEIIKPFKGF